MGRMSHHAIVVTGFQPDWIKKSRAQAVKIFSRPGGLLDDRISRVTPVTAEVVNGYQSFMIAPDGSKEGWETSNRGNEARDEFIAWMRKTCHDDHNCCDWVEIQFGDDDCVTKVVRDSDH